MNTALEVDRIWYTEIPDQKDGMWSPFPDKPGLGLELDPAAVEKYAVRPTALSAPDVIAPPSPFERPTEPFGRNRGCELARHDVERPHQIHGGRPGLAKPSADFPKYTGHVGVGRAGGDRSSQLDRNTHRRGHPDRGRPADDHILDRGCDLLAGSQQQHFLALREQALIEQLHAAFGKSHRKEAHRAN